MKKLRFIIIYILSIMFPVFITIYSVKTLDLVYMLSIFFGIAAFIILCNQFILASRPRFALNALGLKHLLSFHSTMPVVIVIFAIIHRMLKVGIPEPLKQIPFLQSALGAQNSLINGLGWIDNTLQSRIGSLVLLTIVFVIIITILFMANTFWMKIKLLKIFKEWTSKKLGLTFARIKMIHNITVIAGVAILIHILLASSSNFNSNPIGCVWAIGYFSLSIILYLYYKIKHLLHKRAG